MSTYRDKHTHVDELWADGKITKEEAIIRHREIEDDENSRASAVEQYWQDKQGDEYGSY